MQEGEVHQENAQVQVPPVKRRQSIEHPKKSFVIKNPATGVEIDSYPLMASDEVDQVIATARHKFELWSQTSFAQRKAILLKASQYLADNALQYAEEIATENGKTPFDALLADVFMVIDHTRYIAKHGKKALKSKTMWAFNIIAPLRKCTYMYQPKGVVGIISPWNYPFTLSGGPVAAALMAGNAVVLKPSSQTTRSGMILKEIYAKAGLPEGVLQILSGSGSLTGQALIEHTGLDMLFFTGSTEIGLEVAAQAAKNLIPVFLELGGTDVAIVTRNADLDRAAHGVAWGAFTNTGQTCIGTEIILVDRAVYEPFVRKLVPIIKDLKLGKGVGELGSMTMASQHKIVQAQLQDALHKGAKILYQGNVTPDKNGLWCQPTLLAEVTMDMDVFTQETFGPLKFIMVYDTLDEAIQIANSTEYGLSGCVFTKDLQEGRMVAERLKTGSVNINDTLITYAIPELPFGGVKKSGVGFYHGEMGIQAFADVKSITSTNLPFKKEFHWYPMMRDLDKIVASILKILYSGRLETRIKAALTLIPKAPSILFHILKRML